MRIMQVVSYFVPAWGYGGPLRVCHGLSKELIRRGHEVTVYTTDALNGKDRVKEREEIIDGIRVRRFRNLSNALAHDRKIFSSLGMLLAAREDIRGFDVIHVHECRTLHNALIHHYALRFHIPYVVQAHGFRIANTQGLRKLYDTLWGYKLLNDASKVLALGPIEAERYKSMGVSEGKIEILPNGVDLSEFENLPPKGEFRRRWRLDNNHKLILYLGRIRVTKGLELLAQAFADLSKEVDGARLVIVGPDDRYLSTLQALLADMGIADKVLFTGPIYERDRLGAYVDADVFVTPSFDGFPVTFLEACACGTPIITTVRGDKLDWIDNQVGYVVEYDKDQLRNALAKILINADLAERFRKNGPNLIREKFTWTRITEQLEQIYLDMLR